MKLAGDDPPRGDCPMIMMCTDTHMARPHVRIAKERFRRSETGPQADDDRYCSQSDENGRTGERYDPELHVPSSLLIHSVR